MDKFFNGVLKFLAGICALLFVVSVGIALLLFNAERRLFNEQAYIQALESQNFYDRLPALIAETITTSAGTEDPNDAPAFLKTLSPEDLENLIHVILPTDLRKSMVDQAITSVFEALNGKTESASLSLVDFKNYLGGPAGMEAVLQLLSSQPKCTFEQMAEMTASGLLGNGGRIYLCNPPKEYVNSSGRYFFRSMIESTLQTVASSIPDEVPLLKPTGNDSPGTPPASLRVVRAVMRFSPLLPLGLLFLISLPDKIRIGI